MLGLVWHTLFFNPVYNVLVFFIDAVPGGDVGIAIILTTIVVRFILLPFSLKAAHTQFVMREIDPKVKAIKEKFKHKREEQARATMELYKKEGVHPFSSALLLFVQIPIVIALYWSVSRGGGVPLPNINVDLLYSFIPRPETVTMIFLGVIDVAGKSIPLAALAGITQFIHTHLSLPKREPRDKNAPPNFKEDFAHSMQLQMRYVMPFFIFVVAYSISASIALYFVVSNLASIAQEYIVRHKGLKPDTNNKK